MEEKEDIKPLSLEDQTRRIGVRAELVKTMILEEISWRQKSRALWLKEEDKNTKNFHRNVNLHRRNNHIDCLSNGESIWDHLVAITDDIVDFYRGLYSVTKKRP